MLCKNPSSPIIKLYGYMTLISQPIIFGASGFIGQHLIREVGTDKCQPVSRKDQHNKSWMIADLLNPCSLENVLRDRKTVINLSFSPQASPNDNLKMAENLVKACYDSNITRLVHCSTAIVVGNNPALYLNETTPCYPKTAYEQTKYAIEKIFLAAATKQLKICILRPTGVVGSGGQNLKKMFLDIRHGNAVINFVRSSLYGARRLNLVPVEDVVKALLHLCAETITSGIYICSADNDPDNRYDRVEVLMRQFLKKHARIKPVHLPLFCLNMLLRLHRPGGSHFASRYYSSDHLNSTGFQRSITIAQAIQSFVLSELAHDG